MRSSENTELPENLEQFTAPEIERIAGQYIACARRVLRRQKELPEWLVDVLHRIRDAYNEVLMSGGEDEDDDGDAGNPRLFARFKAVLGEVPRRESTGRPFSGNKRLKPADTLRGGTTFIV